VRPTVLKLVTTKEELFLEIAASELGREQVEETLRRKVKALT
jgi:hypothetical protein